MYLDPDVLIAKCGALASLPDAVERVNDLLHDPHASAVEVARATETDAALSAKLLKIVNSPYYGLPSRIDTIPRAVTVIGSRDLGHLLLATTAVSASADLEADMAHIRRHWHHNLHCAVIARLLAEQRHEPQPERFFVAGLLHDLGHLVLLDGAPDQVRRCREQVSAGGLPLHLVEDQLLGFNHAQLGGRLASAWRLPPALTEAIATHHAPTLAHRYRVEAAVVHIADFVAHGLNRPASHDEERARLDALAWQWAELSPHVLESVLSQVESRYADACAALLPSAWAA